ncbi:MAG: sulfotransferase domain-containing protein [Alphaproteobacteria bacterium]|nr:MAG: sulfotransferase domain-containing protein [Alphaproteobacteria bacterium]
MQQPDRHYETMIFDSARWQGFEFRDDDILICTPYKAGTTWTQRICALLVFQTPELDRPLAEITPWMDIKSQPVDDIHAIYEAQKHRRFIKTHTALDGLPWDDRITYLVVQRDPRDVFMSMMNHVANINPESEALMMKEMRDQGAPPPQVPDDPNELFPIWLNHGSFEWEQDGFPFWSVFNHCRTFWEARDKPNVHFMHYSDMKEDLEGQMRRIAKLLDIEVPEQKWPELVDAATFSSMKKNADMMAPDTEVKMWKSNSAFFNKGQSGQWQDALTDENIALYNKLTRERYPADMMSWMEHGGSLSG